MTSRFFFGLSGTGKTTLSADDRRALIGDDEHCWSDDGVFNIEGGCYAKCVRLSRESEPELYGAIKFGTVLENTVFRAGTREVDYDDVSLTQNTRASYPIEYIPNAKIPCVGGHPQNIILLTCDAFGVLPPVSRLTPAQAMYHFVSGYTAKVAGTEVGVTEPEATFSACYGAAFLVWHPTKYAEMLAEKMRTHGSQAWLVNTGWTGGGYGTGSRIKLAYTRAIIDAIHAGDLDTVASTPHPVLWRVGARNMSRRADRSSAPRGDLGRQRGLPRAGTQTGRPVPRALCAVCRRGRRRNPRRRPKRHLARTGHAVSAVATSSQPRRHYDTTCWPRRRVWRRSIVGERD